MGLTVPTLSLSLWNLKTLLYLVEALSPRYVLETSSAFPGPPTIANLAPIITALLYFLSAAVSNFTLLQKITLCLPGLNLFDFIASDTTSAITLNSVYFLAKVEKQFLNNWLIYFNSKTVLVTGLKSFTQNSGLDGNGCQSNWLNLKYISISLTVQELIRMLYNMSKIDFTHLLCNNMLLVYL